MADYFWDLGIDFDMGEDFDDRTYLQMGFYSAGKGDVDTPVKLKKQKTVEFVIYDTTRSGPTVTKVTAAEVEFKKLYPGQPTSPFGGPNPLHFNVTDRSAAKRHSTPFKGEFFYFTCSPAPLLVNDGRFLMKVVVTGENAKGDKRTWQVDPEMLIGEGG